MSKKSVSSIFNEALGVSSYRWVDSSGFIVFAKAILDSGIGLDKAVEYVRDNESARIKESDPNNKSAFQVNWEGSVLSGLAEMCKSPDLMDYAIDCALNDKNVVNYKFIRRAYYSAPRCLMRRKDGTFRSAEHLGLIKGGSKVVEDLVTCAIRHRDPESIEILRTYPTGKALLTDEYIEKAIRDHQRHDDYEEILSCFEDYMPKVALEDMGLEGYWEEIKNEIFHHTTPKSRVLDLYRKDLFEKHPDGFVSTIISMGRCNEGNANYLISLMLQDGMDCYPGYVLGMYGVLAAFDKKGSARDYQTMIDVCLKRKPLPGYIGLLCGIPMDEILRHKRSSHVLSLIHELTGSREAIEKMSRKQRGKALMVDLAL